MQNKENEKPKVVDVDYSILTMNLLKLIRFMGKFIFLSTIVSLCLSAVNQMTGINLLLHAYNILQYVLLDMWPVVGERLIVLILSGLVFICVDSLKFTGSKGDK